MSAVETERRFIISIPDPELLSTKEGYQGSEIEQIYLSTVGITHRIRRRSFSDRVEYTETKKQRISGMSAVETERRITEEEFLSLAKERDRDSMPLLKRRHAFSYLGRVFEVDVYPLWHKYCIMEVELPSEDCPLELPPFIRVLREITGDFRYSNASMSKAFPQEPD